MADPNFLPTRPSALPPTPPIKGSWEELLLRGQRLLTEQNEAGVELLQQLVQRLGQLPLAQRQAAQQRLDQIRLAALFELLSYLTSHDRYEQAVAYTQLAEEFAVPTEHSEWKLYRAYILLQAGALDDAFALLTEQARSGDMEAWSLLAHEAFRYSHLAIVQAACTELEELVNRAPHTETDPTQIAYLHATLSYFKALLALARHKIGEADTWMQHAIACHERYGQKIPSFYGRMIEQGCYQEALPWIQRDRENPRRCHFWSGFVYHHLENPARARQHWQSAIDLPLPESGEVDALDLILARYYLGDPDGVGLAIILDSLRHEEALTVSQFFLAGLGWALRGDPTAAEVNFQTALTHSKSAARGQKLPHIWWRFCQDLIPASSHSRYAHYFNLQPTHSRHQPDSTQDQ
ncbi:MAG: hypothetical protein KGS73_16840 [Chloroflexi bacterium]|nr:hypothetical protein [Chloroflexota bacterium]